VIPKFSELKNKAIEEMMAYDHLPPELQEFVRTSNVGWKSMKVIEYWERLGRDVNATLQLLRGAERCFNNNQVPSGGATIQIKRPERRGSDRSGS